jgi:hypothetical protein
MALRRLGSAMSVAKPRAAWRPNVYRIWCWNELALRRSAIADISLLRSAELLALESINIWSIRDRGNNIVRSCHRLIHHSSGKRLVHA